MQDSDPIIRILSGIIVTAYVFYVCMARFRLYETNLETWSEAKMVCRNTYFKTEIK